MPVTPIQRLVDAARAFWHRCFRPRAAVPADPMAALRHELLRRLGDKIE